MEPVGYIRQQVDIRQRYTKMMRLFKLCGPNIWVRSSPAGCHQPAVVITYQRLSQDWRSHSASQPTAYWCCSEGPGGPPWCPLFWEPTMTCEYQNWTTAQWKESGLVFSFTSCGWPGVCAVLIGERDGTRMHSGKKASWERQCEARNSAEKPFLLPAIPVDATTYLNMVAEQAYPGSRIPSHQLSLSTE